MKRALTLMAVLLMLVPATYAQMMGGGQHGSMMNQKDKNDKNDNVEMNGAMMGNGMMSGMMNGGMMNPLASLMDLGLSDTQINTLVDIHADRIKNGLKIQRTLMKAREKLSTLKRAEDPDYDRIEDQMVRAAKAEAELMKLNADVENRAVQVLTAEQKQALGDARLPLPMLITGSCGMMSGQGNNGSMSGSGHDSHH